MPQKRFAERARTRLPNRLAPAPAAVVPSFVSRAESAGRNLLNRVSPYAEDLKSGWRGVKASLPPIMDKMLMREAAQRTARALSRR